MEDTQELNGAATLHEPLRDADKETEAPAAGVHRLTAEHIRAAVADEDYINIPGTTTTICSLVLVNGFTVIGESACVDPAGFDQKVGCQVAYNNAISKVWQLEGYLLKQRMFEAAQIQAPQ